VRLQIVDTAEDDYLLSHQNIAALHAHAQIAKAVVVNVREIKMEIITFQIMIVMAMPQPRSIVSCQKILCSMVIQVSELGDQYSVYSVTSIMTSCNNVCSDMQMLGWQGPGARYVDNGNALCTVP
jgi:hypothetical protein